MVGDFFRIVTRLSPGVAGHITRGAGHLQQVSELVSYVESPTGPGLEHLARLLDELFPQTIPFHPSTTAESSKVVPNSQESIRGTYIVSFEGTVDGLTLKQATDLLNALMNVAGDDTIKLREFRQGSVQFVLEGSQEGFERLTALHETAELSAMLGVTVHGLTWRGNDPGTEKSANAIPTLARWLDITSSLILSINRARDLTDTRDLNIVLTHALTRAGDLVRAFNRSTTVAAGFIGIVNGGFNYSIIGARSLTYAIIRDLDIVLTSTHAFDTILESARDLAHAIKSVLENDLPQRLPLVVGSTLGVAWFPFFNFASTIAIDMAFKNAVNDALARNTVLNDALTNNNTLNDNNDLDRGIALALALALARNRSQDRSNT